jgi:hypothetical protein
MTDEQNIIVSICFVVVTTSLSQLPLGKPKRVMRKSRMKIRNPSGHEYKYLNALRYHIYSMYPPLIQQGFIHGHDKLIYIDKTRKKYL